MKETKADVGIIFTTAVPKEFNQKKNKFSYCWLSIFKRQNFYARWVF